MTEEKGLYFVALVPAEPLYSRIQSIKEEVAEKYNSKAALKSPPHITLYMPFRWQSKKEGKIHDALKKVSLENSKFELSLKNFSCFEPRVIFIAPEENDALDKLQKDVIKQFKLQLKIHDQGFETRPFHPHITVAFRDLKKPTFYKAWQEEFKDGVFSSSFTADKISLLKHNGKVWLIHQQFDLKG